MCSQHWGYETLHCLLVESTSVIFEDVILAYSTAAFVNEQEIDGKEEGLVEKNQARKQTYDAVELF